LQYLRICIILQESTGIRMRSSHIATILLLVANSLGSQTFDLGISLGAASYNGDLSESVSASLRRSHLAQCLVARLELDPVFSLRLQYTRMTVSGDDADAVNPLLRKRNLHFRSELSEIALTGQLQVFNLFRMEPLRFSPYLFLGAGLCWYSPEAEYGGRWIALRSLGTEGQGMPGYPEAYSGRAVAVLMGTGMRYPLSLHFSVGVEACLRFTNTDYLDDASGNYVAYGELLRSRGRAAADLGNKIDAHTGQQRANPKSNDGYQSLSLSLHYHFGKNPLFKNSLFKNPVRCPAF
jgi:hypothetical protein